MGGCFLQLFKKSFEYDGHVIRNYQTGFPGTFERKQKPFQYQYRPPPVQVHLYRHETCHRVPVLDDQHGMHEYGDNDSQQS